MKKREAIHIHIQSHSDTNSSTAPPFARSPVDSFISSSAKTLNYFMTEAVKIGATLLYVYYLIFR